VTSVTKYPCTHGMLLGLKISKKLAILNSQTLVCRCRCDLQGRDIYALYTWKVARTKVDLLKLRVVVCHIVQVFATRVEERRSQPVDSLIFLPFFRITLKY